MYLGHEPLEDRQVHAEDWRETVCEQAMLWREPGTRESIDVLHACSKLMFSL